MILPFVREVFAELEHSSGFERLRSDLSRGAGQMNRYGPYRQRLSGRQVRLEC